MPEGALRGINYMVLGPLDFCVVRFCFAKWESKNIPLSIMLM